MSSSLSPQLSLSSLRVQAVTFGPISDSWNNIRSNFTVGEAEAQRKGRACKSQLPKHQGHPSQPPIMARVGIPDWLRGQGAILMLRTESGTDLHVLVSFHWPNRLSEGLVSWCSDVTGRCRSLGGRGCESCTKLPGPFPF